MRCWPTQVTFLVVDCRSSKVLSSANMLVLCGRGGHSTSTKGRSDSPRRDFLLCQIERVPISHDIKHQLSELLFPYPNNAGHLALAIKLRDPAATLGPQPPNRLNTTGMSWKAVNATVSAPHQEQKSQVPDEASDGPINASTSKYRVNILHAAEKLATCGPKRKRRASKPVATDPAPKKFKKTSSKKQKTIAAELLQNDNDGKAISPKRRSARLQTPNIEKHNELSNAPEPDAQATTPEDGNLGLFLQEASKGNEPKVIIEDELASSAQKDKIADLAEVAADSAEVKASSAVYLPELLVTEIFSDDSSTNFDDFDDSIFDEPLQAGLEVDSLRITLSSSTPVLATTPRSKDSDYNKLGAPSAPGSRAKHSNGAPLAPFMHPCLLDSLDAEALALNENDASMPSLKHTCFRAAELLRLSKTFKSKPIAQGSNLITEFFTIVKEVKYANSQGHGQGLVLADAFFPDKPPFITASSKTPYNARGLIPRDNAKGEKKSPVKASIKVPGLKTTPTGGATQSKPSPVKSCPSPSHNDISGFEITAMRTSS